MFGEEFDKDPVLRIVVDIPHKTPIHFTKILSEEVNQLLQLLWVLGLFILIVHSSGNCHTFVLVPGRCTQMILRQSIGARYCGVIALWPIDM